MPRQPLYSVLITAGVRSLRSQADVVGGQPYVQIANTNFLTKVQAWLSQDASWPSAVYLELAIDYAQIATVGPMWWFEVFPVDPARTTPPGPRPRNELDFHQPLDMTQIHAYFRGGAPWPDGTVIPNGSHPDFRILFEGFPNSLTGSGDLG